MDNYTIRLAESGDQPRIEEIVNHAFVVYVPRMNKMPFPMLDDYGAHIARQNMYVMEQGGQIVACMTLSPTEHGALALDNLAVDPRSQKAGLGKAMLNFAETLARGTGYERIALYTNEMMWENVPWYEKNGYSIVRRGVENGYRRVYLEKKL